MWVTLSANWVFLIAVDVQGRIKDDDEDSGCLEMVW